MNNQILVFGEHQSTINRNMPLRCLMYAGRTYEKLVDTEARYKEKLAMIPTPEFYTFYNGQDDYPAEQTLRLSDAFRKQPGNNSLELKVRVININSEKNHVILKKCEILKEYSIFIDKIRKYQLNGKKDAIKAAIQACIQEGILVEYLCRKGSEVRNMLIAEYSYETDIRVKQEEAREDGIEYGKKLGIDQGQRLKLIQLVCKKLARGRKPKDIADALEEDVSEIETICEAAADFAPDYDCEMIYKKMTE